MSGKYVGYVNENHRNLIAERLYLPTDWANDPIRRIECGVPEDVIFKTKGELALEMLLDAEERKFRQCASLDRIINYFVKTNTFLGYRR